MEYMEAAKPVVGTRVMTEIPDLIDDGVHGRLVEPQDPDGPRRAVADLLRDPERARESRAAAAAAPPRGVRHRRDGAAAEELYVCLRGEAPEANSACPPRRGSPLRSSPTPEVVGECLALPDHARDRGLRADRRCCSPT